MATAPQIWLHEDGVSPIVEIEGGVPKPIDCPDCPCGQKDYSCFKPDNPSFKALGGVPQFFKFTLDQSHFTLVPEQNFDCNACAPGDEGGGTGKKWMHGTYVVKFVPHDLSRPCGEYTNTNPGCYWLYYLDQGYCDGMFSDVYQECSPLENWGVNYPSSGNPGPRLSIEVQQTPFSPSPPGGTWDFWLRMLAGKPGNLYYQEVLWKTNLEVPNDEPFDFNQPLTFYPAESSTWPYLQCAPAGEVVATPYDPDNP